MELVEEYTRENAIADGLLIDVTRLAKEYTGIEVDVAISKTVWNGPVIHQDPESWRGAIIIAANYKTREPGPYRSAWGVTDPKITPLILNVQIKVDFGPNGRKRVTVFCDSEVPDYRCQRIRNGSFHLM